MFIHFSKHKNSTLIASFLPSDTGHIGFGSLLVRALKRYSKDPGSGPSGDCFQVEDALASGSRRSPNLG